MRSWVLLTCAVLVSGFGCGEKIDRPKVYRTEGVIKLNGAPVANVSVTFYPDKGRPASAKTDSAGRFQLTTFNTGDGTTAGRHKVVVVAEVAATIVSNTPGELEAIEKATSKVPKKYSSPDTTDLVNTVEPNDKNNFVIDLK